jgi:caffeoyl-CoA O-methyltransferase
MDFIPGGIQAYAERHTEPESDLLREINRHTHLHILKARMLSGHLQGRVLSMLSHMIRPKCVLEIGTYTGYSALCLAEGMQAGGQLITIDKNEELADMVRGAFQKSPYSAMLDLKIGNAVDIIASLPHVWDLVFIDADKENYLNYYNLVIENVRAGGYIIADNVLWSGHVVDDSRTDKDTEAIRAFNRAVHNDSRVQNVLLPVRDGLMVLRKL